MKVFTSTLEVLSTLHTCIVLLVQNVKALLIGAVDGMVLTEMNLSLNIHLLFFGELYEGLVVPVHVVQ